MGKARPLDAIRRQTAARQRLSAVADVDSAYSRLSRANQEFTHAPSSQRWAEGYRRDDSHHGDYYEDGEEEVHEERQSNVAAPKPARKKTTIGTFSVRKTQPKPKTKSKPKQKPTTKETTTPPDHQNQHHPRPHPTDSTPLHWRPAGGEKPFTTNTNGKSKEPTLTPVLGLARVPTWRLGPFVEAAKQLIRQHGVIEDMAAEELVQGGESVTDVYVRFADEGVAERVKAGVDGSVVLGRVLGVAYV
ncbi:hypothetical protein BDY17DRAFT_322588 [Neohortaea acidophila]|uniref:Uncharacterized protein n=1 Tax=Neohortaea acidophila TaxID=245834 RepID=A0A6A6Q1A9_9PEZI|nr:uncharacterized protein BDY17DRAFT_322588 [Neohortaea acidophila]KAF2485776.1 hypothetical protein BDY17DRAFT_322588 [Neohortaea acidophila]